MKQEPLHLLIIEDCEDDVFLVLDQLRHEGLVVNYRRVETAEDLQQALRSESWDAVLSDYQLPGFTALDALQIYKQHGLDIPFIIVSGSIGEDIAVEAMRHGAHDYLLKDRLARLPVAIERELRETQNRREKREAEYQRARTAEELRLRNEELSVRAEQLYRSNKDLERFAYVAAHDLQEPLRTISSYSQLLVRRYGQNQPEASQLVQFITEGVTRMQALIDGLLTYSRVTHELEQEQTIVSVRQLLDTVLHQLGEQIADNGAVITCGPLPNVRADQGQLSQVFQKPDFQRHQVQEARHQPPYSHFGRAHPDQGHLFRA